MKNNEIEVKKTENKEVKVSKTEIRFTLYTTAGQFKFEMMRVLSEGQSKAENMMEWLKEIKAKREVEIIKFKEPTGRFSYFESNSISGFKVEDK